jgi:hypothetical protein
MRTGSSSLSGLDDSLPPRVVFRAPEAVPVELRLGADIDHPGIFRHRVQAPGGQAFDAGGRGDDFRAQDEVEQELEGSVRGACRLADRMFPARPSYDQKGLERMNHQQDDPDGPTGLASGEDAKGGQSEDDGGFQGVNEVAGMGPQKEMTVLRNRRKEDEVGNEPDQRSNQQKCRGNR